MYTEESIKKLLEVVLDAMEFNDLSLDDYNEAHRIYKNLKGDLKK